MKRIATIGAIITAFAVAPSVAAAGNVSAQFKPQVSAQVIGVQTAKAQRATAAFSVQRHLVQIARAERLLPADDPGHDRAGRAVDDRAPPGLHPHGFRPGHVVWRADGLAQDESHRARAVAALHDPFGHSLLPAGHAIHLRGGDELATAARSAAAFTAGTNLKPELGDRRWTSAGTPSCRPLRSSWRHRLLGPRHARDDDHHPGRGLSAHGGGQRPPSAHDLHAVRAAQRAAAPGDLSGDLAGDGDVGRRAGGGDLRLSGRGEPALHGDRRTTITSSSRASPCSSSSRSASCCWCWISSIRSSTHASGIGEVNGSMAVKKQRNQVLGWISRNRLRGRGHRPRRLLIALFGVVGRFIRAARDMAEVGAARLAKPPSVEHLLGTDQQGRDVLADLIYGTPTSLEIGLIAGVIGVTVGALDGPDRRLCRGHRRRGDPGGRRYPADDTEPDDPDHRRLHGGRRSVEAMALIIAALAWMWPARTVRAQVLTDARAHVRPGGQAQRRRAPEDHHRRAAAEPAAVPGGQPGRRGLRRRSSPRSASRRSGWGRMTKPTLGLTHLLGDLLRRPHPRDVVVVHAAHRHHRHPLPRAVPV